MTTTIGDPVYAFDVARAVRVLDYVRAHPGRGAHQIARALGYRDEVGRGLGQSVERALRKFEAAGLVEARPGNPRTWHPRTLGDLR